MKRVDLTGRRFGALVALRPATGEERRNGRPSWVCRCDCGRECVQLGDNLRNGRVSSCGCRAGVGAKLRGTAYPDMRVDYTGRRFGELVGVEWIGRGLWLWECSCGRRVAIRTGSVTSGQTISCGHVLAESARRRVEDEDVLGHVDGTSLSVIRGIVRGTVRTSNTSGVTGVRVRKRADGSVRYEASITYQGKTHRLGSFDNLQDAADARRRAEADIFGEVLERHGWDR